MPGRHSVGREGGELQEGMFLYDVGEGMITFGSGGQRGGCFFKKSLAPKALQATKKKEREHQVFRNQNTGKSLYGAQEGPRVRGGDQLEGVWRVMGGKGKRGGGKTKRAQFIKEEKGSSSVQKNVLEPKGKGK